MVSKQTREFSFIKFILKGLLILRHIRKNYRFLNNIIFILLTYFYNKNYTHTRFRDSFKMKCPDCNKEYSDPNQQICEYCGTELSRTEQISPKVSPTKTKVEQFIEDTGLKELYKKIKDSLKNV